VSIHGDTIITEEPQRAGAGTFLNKTDLANAPPARLLGGE
jgi:hypothetical protein